MTQIVDPPEGWRWGFPRVYNPLPNETYREWLIRMGYKGDLDLAEKHSRYWFKES
jgi:hypothetical protein